MTFVQSICIGSVIPPASASAIVHVIVGKSGGWIPGSVVVHVDSISDAELAVSHIWPTHAHIVSLPSVDWRWSSDCADIASAMQLRARSLFDQLGNSVHDAWQGVAAAVRNLRRWPSCAGSDSLAGLHHGRTAVCIAAGPSADDILPRIKDQLPNSVVFACEVCAPMLKRHGIRPDYICTVERPENVVDCHDPDPSWTTIAPVTACSDGLAKYGRVIWWLTRNPITAWAIGKQAALTECDPLSAGVLTVQAAVAAGCSTIYLVGHDLVASGSQTHADGVVMLPDAPTGPQLQASSVERGGMTTTYLWDMFAAQIEGVIAKNPAKTFARIEHRQDANLPLAGCWSIQPDAFIIEKPPMPIGVISDTIKADSNATASRLADSAARMMDIAVKADELLRKLDHGEDQSNIAIDAQLSNLGGDDLCAYLLQSIYSAMHLRIHLGRDFRTCIRRLLLTVREHALLLESCLSGLSHEK